MAGVGNAEESIAPGSSREARRGRRPPPSRRRRRGKPREPTALINIHDEIYPSIITGPRNIRANRVSDRGTGDGRRIDARNLRGVLSTNPRGRRLAGNFPSLALIRSAPPVDSRRPIAAENDDYPRDSGHCWFFRMFRDSGDWAGFGGGSCGFFDLRAVPWIPSV